MRVRRRAAPSQEMRARYESESRYVATNYLPLSHPGARASFIKQKHKYSPILKNQQISKGGLFALAG